MRFRPKSSGAGTRPLLLKMPTRVADPGAVISTWTLVQSKAGKVRMQRVDGGEDRIERSDEPFTIYGAAVELASNYHCPLADLASALRVVYGDSGEVPTHHLAELGEQIEAQSAGYETYWEEIDVALALVKPDGFEQRKRHGKTTYTARVSFSKDREYLYRTADQLAEPDSARRLSFHYEGYNFDSSPEANYLERVLALVEQQPEHIEGVWFTGGLSDPKKTELIAEYQGEDGRWHRYTPDFVIQRKDGKHLVVEVKRDDVKPVVEKDLKEFAKGKKPVSVEGRKAVALKRWELLNPDVLQYSLVFADTHVGEDALKETKAFIQGKATNAGAASART